MRAASIAWMGILLCAGAAADTAPGDAGDLPGQDRYDEAAAAARARMAADTDPGDAQWILAESLSATGRNQEALAAYGRIPQGPDGPRLQVEMAIAGLERLLGRTPEWRPRVRRVLAAYRQRSAALPALEIRAAGDAAWMLARDDPALYPTALEIYERAIGRDPDDPASHVAIGDLLLDRYNSEEALEAYRAALALDENYPPAILGVARSRRFDHSYGAVEAAERVLQLNPRSAAALVLLGRLHLELEDYSSAETFIDRALAVNPRSPEALTLSAALAFLRGDDGVFESRVDEIRKFTPGYTAVYETLAEIVAQNRFYARAERFARTAINLNPSSWKGHALLGINRLRLGEMSAGRAALETAFRGDPFDPRTKNALELLDVLDDYEKIRSARFVFSAHPREMPVLAPRVIAIAEEAYEHFSNAYGFTPRTPIRIEFYRRHEDFSVRTTGLVGVDVLGVSFGPVVALDSPSAGVFGPVNFGSTLWHEIAHSFHLAMTNSRVPRWFSEGLAVFEERRARSGWGFDVSPGFLLAFQQGRLAPISGLNQAFLRPGYPEQTIHAYFQGALLMEMIERNHGFPSIVRMLEGYRDGQSTAELFRTVLGTEPAAVDTVFDAYLRQRFGRAIDAMVPGADDGDGDAARGRYPRLLSEARRAMEAKERDAAVVALTEAQALFPEHAGPGSTYSLLAALHREAGAVASAIAQLERAVAIDADDLDAHRRLAELYLEAGDRGAAADIIDRTLLIEPFDATLHRKLAEIREALSDWRRAAAARQAVAALDPGDPAEARYLLARAHHRSGDLESARREVLSALEAAPMYEEALELLLEIRNTPEA